MRTGLSSSPAPEQRPSNPLTRPFLRFLIVGGLNTAFGYGVFAGLVLLGAWYPVAALVSTVLGVLFNFVTTGVFVFNSRKTSRLLRFVGVYGVCYVVGVLVLRVTSDFGISVLVTSAVMLLPMALFSYTLQRLLVFREDG